MSGRARTSLLVGSGLVLAALAAAWWLGHRAPGSAALAVSPERVDFGEVAVGERREAFVVLTNLGDAEAVVDAVSVPAPFLAPAEPLRLAAGESRSIGLTFAPEREGLSEGQLEISGARATLSVALRGEAQGLPVIHVEPRSLTFGNVEVGGSSKAVVTVRNKGARALDVNELRVTGPFESAIDRNVIEPGSSAVLEVRFTPPAARTWDGSLSIMSSDPRRAGVRVVLRGQGVGDPPKAAIHVSPRALDFGSVPVGEMRKQWITIRNEGSDALQLASVAVATPFRASTRSRRVGPGSELRFPVLFSPSQEGSIFDALVIHSNDPAASVLTVSLLGAGERRAGTTQRDGTRRGDPTGSGGGQGSTGGGVALGSDAGNGSETPGETPGFEPGDGETPSDAAPPDEGLAVASGPRILDDSEVILESYPARFGDSAIGNFTMDPATGVVVLENFQLPTVYAAGGEYFTFSPTNGTGSINELGDIHVTIPVEVFDRFGNSSQALVELTTGDAVAYYGLSEIVVTGQPIDPSGQFKLVGAVNFQSGPVLKTPMRVSLNGTID